MLTGSLRNSRVRGEMRRTLPGVDAGSKGKWDTPVHTVAWTLKEQRFDYDFGHSLTEWLVDFCRTLPSIYTIVPSPTNDRPLLIIPVSWHQSPQKSHTARNGPTPRARHRHFSDSRSYVQAILLTPSGNRAEIKSTPRKTFPYGSDPRQCLDIYYPSSPPRNLAECPILVFVYGGGLVNGSKNLPLVENDLVYANLGHYFAETHGCIVVIPDYRLVPQAQFPSGGEDVALTINWIESNINQLGGSQNVRELFLLGNSAGGVHLSTYLFSRTFTELQKHMLSEQIGRPLRLSGAIFVSVPFHFEAASASRRDVLKSYYGDRRTEDCPLGLLKDLLRDMSVSKAFPGVKFLVLTASLDPDDEILEPSADFVTAWNSKEPPSTPSLQIGLIKGHNHISPVLSLGTGDIREEAWGKQVAGFCGFEGGDLNSHQLNSK